MFLCKCLEMNVEPQKPSCLRHAPPGPAATAKGDSDVRGPSSCCDACDGAPLWFSPCPWLCPCPCPAIVDSEVLEATWWRGRLKRLGVPGGLVSNRRSARSGMRVATDSGCSGGAGRVCDVRARDVGGRGGIG